MQNGDKSDFDLMERTGDGQVYKEYWTEKKSGKGKVAFLVKIFFF